MRSQVPCSLGQDLIGYDPPHTNSRGNKDRVDALYLISNAWGPKHGGINAFNTDFAKHLGLALGRRLKAGCIVLEADAKEIADAANCQVDLIPIGPSPSHAEFDPARAHDILVALQAGQVPTDNACWIGHDIVTGDVAKHDRQRSLFRAAHRVFGVGPLLRDRPADMLDRDPNEVGTIIPGLPEIDPRRTPTTFTACTFGRLDPENDRIKQGRLAVAGFADLCRRADDPGRPRALARPPY
jgi:hypothetical protein